MIYVFKPVTSKYFRTDFVVAGTRYSINTGKTDKAEAQAEAMRLRQETVDGKTVHSKGGRARPRSERAARSSSRRGR